MRVIKKYRLLCSFAIMLLCIGFSPDAKAQDVNYKAYSVYVYNFIKYIEWPPENLKTDDFVIAIIGDSPVKSELQALAASKKANGKRIVIKQYNKIEDVEHCQIMYISSGKSGLLKSAIESTKTMSALLITEREGLAKKGAGINFVTLEDETLKFELNTKVLEGSKLKVSYQLKSLALVVK
jgi:hypothetical protein